MLLLSTAFAVRLWSINFISKQHLHSAVLFSHWNFKRCVPLCLYSMLTVIWSQFLYQPDRILEFTAGFSPSKNHTEPKLIFDSVPEAGRKKKVFLSFPSDDITKNIAKYKLLFSCGQTRVRDGSVLTFREAVLLPLQMLPREEKQGPFQAIRNPVGSGWYLTVNIQKLKQLRGFFSGPYEDEKEKFCSPFLRRETFLSNGMALRSTYLACLIS